MLFSASKQKLFVLLALLFFSFICYIIVCADIGQPGLLANKIRYLPFGDKGGHFLLYGLLTLLVNLALNNRRVQLGSWLLLAGSLGVTIFAIGEELTQLFLANRSFELADIACDLLGIFAFSLFAVKSQQQQNQESDLYNS